MRLLLWGWLVGWGRWFGVSCLFRADCLGSVVQGWLLGAGCMRLVDCLGAGWLLGAGLLMLFGVGCLGLVGCSTFTGGGCEAVLRVAPVPCRKEPQPT